MKNFIKMTCVFLAFSICILTGGAISTKSFDRNKNLCLYVMHSPNKKFCEYRKTVIHDLAKYYKVIVISNGELDDTCDEVEQIIKRPNQGYDFGAWKEYILKNYDYIKQFDNLLLANDSFLRVSPLDKAIEQGLNGDADLYGMTASKEIRFHLQSYFINVKKRAISSKSFFNFWKNLPEFKILRDAVLGGETKFTEHLQKAGFKVNDFYDLKLTNMPKYNVTLCYATFMLNEQDFPILKKKALRS